MCNNETTPLRPDSLLGEFAKASDSRISHMERIYDHRKGRPKGEFKGAAKGGAKLLAISLATNNTGHGRITPP